MSIFPTIISDRLSKDYKYLSVPADNDANYPKVQPNLTASTKYEAKFTQREVDEVLKKLIAHGIDENNSVVIAAKTWADLIKKES